MSDTPKITVQIDQSSPLAPMLQSIVTAALPDVEIVP